MYYRNRIHLEVFHALSDGTGASWFLQLLITNYVLLRYPESRSERIELPEEFQYTRYESGSQLDDSFTRYFNKKKNEKSINVKEMNPDESEKRKWKRVYQIYGRKTQDNRMQIIESEMPAKDLLKISKDRNITLSVLLTAIFIESIHKTIKRKNKERRLQFLPINLHNFISHILRNLQRFNRYTFDQKAKRILLMRFVNV